MGLWFIKDGGGCYFTSETKIRSRLKTEECYLHQTQRRSHCAKRYKVTRDQDTVIESGRQVTVHRGADWTRADERRATQLQNAIIPPHPHRVRNASRTVRLDPESWSKRLSLTCIHIHKHTERNCGCVIENWLCHAHVHTSARFCAVIILFCLRVLGVSVHSMTQKQKY